VTKPWYKYDNLYLTKSNHKEGRILLEDQEAMISAINQTMPFGKYAGRKLLQLPEPYLVWFHSKGFPEGKLGQQLALMYEIKLNGLEEMLKPLLRS
jgi:uncharacterized protein (DUF3820 family)